MTQQSIFKKLFSDEEFFDRFANDKTHAVDIIIPVLHTNELWEKNLISIYREIPVNRLLLGDAGCIDDTIEIAKKFPRVEIFDHRKYKTLGKSIMELVREVKTEFFIYLHSDVYIAEGWFDKFYKNTEKYDWFECERKLLNIVEYEKRMDYNSENNWGFGGTQMGRTEAFHDILDDIDDDYLYRNEDIIIRTALQKKGHKWGFDSSLIHYHEYMYKPSPNGRKTINIQITEEKPEHEKFKEANMQFRGFVKYLEPTTSRLRQDALYFFHFLIDNNYDEWFNLMKWIEETNSNWLVIFPRKEYKKYKRLKFFKKLFKK